MFIPLSLFVYTVCRNETKPDIAAPNICIMQKNVFPFFF